LPFICGKCNRNYCIRHRNEIDHECEQIPKHTIEKEVNTKRLYKIFQRQAASENSISSGQSRGQTSGRTNSRTNPQSIQPGSLSDKEAMDLALKMSLQDSSASRLTAVNVNLG